MGEFPFRGRLAVLATMHRKEQAIAPVLEEALGLQVEVPPGLDTDRFGTFTREVPRPGTQLATARLKAQAALAAVPEADFRSPAKAVSGRTHGCRGSAAGASSSC